MVVVKRARHLVITSDLATRQALDVFGGRDPCQVGGPLARTQDRTMPGGPSGSPRLRQVRRELVEADRQALELEQPNRRWRLALPVDRPRRPQDPCGLARPSVSADVLREPSIDLLDDVHGGRAIEAPICVAVRRAARGDDDRRRRVEGRQRRHRRAVVAVDPRDGPLGDEVLPGAAEPARARQGSMSPVLVSGRGLSV